MTSLYVKTLRRAVGIAGDEQKLSLRLNVKRSHLSIWLRGLCDPPVHVFLRAVDLVTESDMVALAAPERKHAIAQRPITSTSTEPEHS